MSTFDGIIEEFPFIRIDYFRKNPDRPSPLACFLSHVHSDHLQGLESLRASFVYCSAATRELLLRIEKYPHRMNFSKGILESRKQHYKHLSKLLRPIPLNTPTEIELTPRLRIRVTLLDANHCVGAVMFLIEGDGKAILYSGDIRAETWWVNSLIRNPVLIPYTLGQRRLDKIYLDTTFAVKPDVYLDFPSKAEGIKELLEKVQAYPDDTVFYFRAWTFGYEDVWQALSAALNSKIHVDRYQMELYRSLGSGPRDRARANEAPFLSGFDLGNKFISGCLTDDETARIHSCEPGVFCSTIASGKAVYITPIVTRTWDGSEVPETGAGGGSGDLYQTHELELPDESAVEQLEKLCLEQIHDREKLSQTREALISAFKSKKKTLSLNDYGLKEDSDISLKKLVTVLSHGQSRNNMEDSSFTQRVTSNGQDKCRCPLPNVINFPYSRHSSYAELCEFVSAFKPKEIFPCTIDSGSWSEEVSMSNLFGHLCSGDTFTHDNHMRGIMAQKQPNPDAMSEDTNSQGSSNSSSSSPTLSRKLSHQQSVISDSEEAVPMNETLMAKRQVAKDRIWKARLTGEDPETVRKIEVAKIRRCETKKRARNGRLISSSKSKPERDSGEGSYLERDDSIFDSSSESEEDEEAYKARRATIREIWRGLMSVKDELLFHVFTLPPDLQAEEDEYQRQLQAEREKQQQQQSPLKDDKDAPHCTDNKDNINTNTNSQETELTISDSAFDSQNQHLLQQEEAQAEDDSDDYVMVDKPPQHSSKETSPEVVDSAHLFARSLAIRTRKAAYRAARTGSYDAWSDVALLSAGNNHTEEEIEL
ncbi:hypothetical protein VTN00DRAFT_7808 [Thermoascus crustaceus]|uniref:uncharacterized protein n=1 Tax=Thermoascus crustaceus TaxID=5088 RepID=UPI003743C3FB